MNTITELMDERTIVNTEISVLVVERNLVKLHSDEFVAMKPQSLT